MAAGGLLPRMPVQKDIGTVGKSKWTAIITRGPLLILTDPHIHRTASPSASAFFITMAMPTTDINTTAEASTITVEAEECMEKMELVATNDQGTRKTNRENRMYAVDRQSYATAIPEEKSDEKDTAVVDDFYVYFGWLYSTYRT